jgi:hypothetical protein
MEHKMLRQRSNSYSRNNRTNVGSGVFCAVRPGGSLTAISQLQQKAFSVGSVSRLYHEDQRDNRDCRETDQSELSDSRSWWRRGRRRSPHCFKPLHSNAE